jgi:hypothetical protein
MNLLAVLQSATPLSPIVEQILVGVFVTIFIVFLLSSRRLKRGASQNTATYNARTGLIFSVICIVWGGALWFVILWTQRYDNVLAIVGASTLTCVGVYSLAMSLRKKN